MLAVKRETSEKYNVYAKKIVPGFLVSVFFKYKCRFEFVLNQSNCAKLITRIT